MRKISHDTASTIFNNYDFGNMALSPRRPPVDTNAQFRRRSNMSANSPGLSFEGGGTNSMGTSRKGSLDCAPFNNSPLLSVSSADAGQKMLPRFVSDFVTGSTVHHDTIGNHQSSKELIRTMLSMLEKQQVIDMLCQGMEISQQPLIPRRSTSTAASLESIIQQNVAKYTTFRRLLVRNISFNSTTEEVKQLLSSVYGRIEEGTVVYDRQTNRSKGFAFITFEKVEDACTAILDSLDGLIMLDNRQLILKFASDRVTPTVSTDTIPPSYEAAVTALPHSIPHPPSTIASTPASLSCDKQNRKLFVYNLSPLTTSESLHRAFARHGPMEECTVVVDASTGMSKRYAFVTYLSEESAWRCLQEPSKTVDGQMTFCHFASEGPPVVGASSYAPTRNGHSSPTAPRTPPTDDEFSIESNMSIVQLLSGIMGDQDNICVKNRDFRQRQNWTTL